MSANRRYSKRGGKAAVNYGSYITAARNAYRYAPTVYKYGKSMLKRYRAGPQGGRFNIRRLNPFRPRPARRGRYRIPSKKSQKFNKMLTKCASGVAHKVYKQRRTGVDSSGVNRSSFNNHTFSSLTNVKDSLESMDYFDPSNPAVLQNVDLNTGAYSREILFKNIHCRFVARNNYLVPVRCTLYVVTPKRDSNTDAKTRYTEGLTDVGNPDPTSTMVFPTDSPHFNDFWSIAKTKTKILKAGDALSMTWDSGMFCYDPSEDDNHIFLYMRKIKSALLCIRLEGVIGHDTIELTEQTNLSAKIDFELTRKFDIMYDAGVASKRIELDDQADAAFSTLGVVSNKPISANQSLTTAAGT